LYPQIGLSPLWGYNHVHSPRIPDRAFTLIPIIVGGFPGLLREGISPPFVPKPD